MIRIRFLKVFFLCILGGGFWGILLQPAWATLPRMASLKSKEVNARVGPGEEYPVVWIFLCQGLPVRIVAEFDMWRKIEDPLGGTGWIHKRLLSVKPTLFLISSHPLLKSPQEDAKVIANLEKGVIVDKEKEVRSENQTWYAVKIQGFKGFLPKTACWDEIKGQEPKK